MDKKEIYEHLAKIYLDASKGKKRKAKKSFFEKNRNLLIAAVGVLSLSLISLNFFKPKERPYAETALVICPDAVKINFNFDPAKKEIYSVDLKDLDLSRFKTLAFSVKKINCEDNIPLKVEFNSAYKEKSDSYIQDLSCKWKDHKINLADFKNISDWSRMANLSFIVEEWNAEKKHGVVYLDNVRLLK